VAELNTSPRSVPDSENPQLTKFEAKHRETGHSSVSSETLTAQIQSRREVFESSFAKVYARQPKDGISIYCPAKEHTVVSRSGPGYQTEFGSFPPYPSLCHSSNWTITPSKETTIAPESGALSGRNWSAQSTPLAQAGESYWVSMYKISTYCCSTVLYSHTGQPPYLPL